MALAAKGIAPITISTDEALYPDLRTQKLCNVIAQLFPHCPLTQEFIVAYSCPSSHYIESLSRFRQAFIIAIELCDRRILPPDHVASDPLTLLEQNNMPSMAALRTAFPDFQRILADLPGTDLSQNNFINKISALIDRVSDEELHPLTRARSAEAALGLCHGKSLALAFATRENRVAPYLETYTAVCQWNEASTLPPLGVRSTWLDLFRKIMQYQRDLSITNPNSAVLPRGCIQDKIEIAGGGFKKETIQTILGSDLTVNCLQDGFLLVYLYYTENSHAIRLSQVGDTWVFDDPSSEYGPQYFSSSALALHLIAMSARGLAFSFINLTRLFLLTARDEHELFSVIQSPSRLTNDGARIIMLHANLGCLLWPFYERELRDEEAALVSATLNNVDAQSQDTLLYIILASRKALQLQSAFRYNLDAFATALQALPPASIPDLLAQYSSPSIKAKMVAFFTEKTPTTNQSALDVLSIKTSPATLPIIKALIDYIIGPSHLLGLGVPPDVVALIHQHGFRTHYKEEFLKAMRSTTKAAGQTPLRAFLAKATDSDVLMLINITGLAGRLLINEEQTRIQLETMRAANPRSTTPVYNLSGSGHELLTPELLPGTPF